MAFDSWHQEMMHYMTTVKYNSLEERFVIFIKLFSDIWSGLSAVVKTFASVDKSVQFVDVAGLLRRYSHYIDERTGRGAHVYQSVYQCIAV